jgi:hypothetical protein
MYGVFSCAREFIARKTVLNLLHKTFIQRRRGEMLKIQQSQQTRYVRICLSGRVSHDQLPYLDELIRIASDSRLTVLFDIEQVTVLDLQVVRYLAEGEGTKFEFSCCPRAIGQWIRREQKIAALAASIPNSRTART